MSDRSIQRGGRLAAMVLGLTLSAVATAEAHHVMGGRTPQTFAEGLLSGLGHPMIGIDHLAFIVAVGLVVGMAGLSVLLPAAFVVASVIGVVVHVGGLNLPLAEGIVAASVLLAGGLIAAGWNGAGSNRTLWWFALFAIAGLFHGYAYGESIVGAERSPLYAYLIGLMIIQGALATGIALALPKFREVTLGARLAGAVIAGVGLAALAGHVVPT